MKMMLLATLLLIGEGSFAQEKGKETKISQEKKLTPEERADRFTKKMTEKFGLTPEQSAQINTINLGIAKKNEGIRGNKQMTKEEKAKIIKGNHDSRVVAYRNVLTAEQMTQYEAWEKQKREKVKANKGKNKPSKTIDSDEL